jgi:HSP20 family protein
VHLLERSSFTSAPALFLCIFWSFAAKEKWLWIARKLPNRHKTNFTSVASLLQPQTFKLKIVNPLNEVTYLSEDEKKKKYYYYYGGKEKKDSEIKKSTQEAAPYSAQADFDRMMKQFQRSFDEFWETPLSKWGGNIRKHAFAAMDMPSVDLEDRGKDYRLVVDLPGFNKEDVDLEVTEDSITVQAKRTQSEEEKQKNYVHKERSSQAFYRSIVLPEMVRSDDAKASMNNGILEVVLPKKEPKKTKKVAVT